MSMKNVSSRFINIYYVLFLDKFFKIYLSSENKEVITIFNKSLADFV